MVNILYRSKVGQSETPFGVAYRSQRYRKLSLTACVVTEDGGPCIACSKADSCSSTCKDGSIDARHATATAIDLTLRFARGQSTLWELSARDSAPTEIEVVTVLVLRLFRVSIVMLGISRNLGKASIFSERPGGIAL